MGKGDRFGSIAAGGRASLSVPSAPRLHCIPSPTDNPHSCQRTCPCAIMINSIGELRSFHSRSVLQTSSHARTQSYAEITDGAEWGRNKWGGTNADCLFKTLLLVMPCPCSENKQLVGSGNAPRALQGLLECRFPNSVTSSG